MKKYLTEEMESRLFLELETAIKNNDSAEEDRIKTEIVDNINPLVSRIVYKMQGFGVDNEELKSEAYLELINSIRKFDRKRGIRFTTYAVNNINYKLITYSMDNSSMFKISNDSTRKKLFLRFDSALKKIIKEGDNSVLGEFNYEIARKIGEKLDVDPSIVEEFYTKRNLCYYDESYDESPYCQRVDSKEEEVDKRLSQHTMQDIFREALKCLDEREEYIITNYLLKESEDRMKLKEFAKKFNFSTERARQVKKRAQVKFERRVKNIMSERGLKASDLV